MRSDLVLNLTMNDLVFKGRNKSYGAYFLRKTYDLNMTKGIIIGVGVFLLMITSPVFRNQKTIISPIFPDDVDDTLIFDGRPMPERIIKPKIASAPAAKPADPQTTRVVADDKILKVPIEKPETTIVDNPIGTEPSGTGSTDPIGTDNGGISGQGNGTENGTAVGDNDDDNKYVPVPEVMPEFPGGPAELYKYISKNIRYPQMAYENGIEGIVVVQFVVDREGNITRTNVVREIGGGCEAEALRVVSKMPRWSPGKMGGKNVPVLFSLPIKFKLPKR